MDWCDTQIPFAREIVIIVRKKSFPSFEVESLMFQLKLIDEN